jgi:hypothetical protein
MGKDETFAAAVVVCALLACKSGEQRASEQQTKERLAAAVVSVAIEPPAATASARPSLLDIPEAPCVLNAAGKPSVPIFPTAEAIREWNSALARKDWDAAEAARKGERAFLVKSGTKCTRLDIELDVARVRVVTGDHLGEVGWTRREWSFAKGKDDE